MHLYTTVLTTPFDMDVSNHSVFLWVSGQIILHEQRHNRISHMDDSKYNVGITSQMDPIQLSSEATRERQGYLRLALLMQETKYDFTK
jgi:hypothetical protein